MYGKFPILFVVAGLLAAKAAFAAGIAGPPPASLKGPCAAAMAGPDYVAGVDASGNPVPRADIGAEKAPIPGDLALPLPNRAQGRGRRPETAPYVTLDGKKLDALLNPPACPR